MHRGSNVTADEVIEIFRHWAAVMDKRRAFLDPKRDETIRKALHAGASIEDCKLAIDGCKASRWHMGQNDRHTVYNDLSLILRDAQHIERFCEIAEEAQAQAQRTRAKAAEAAAPKREMPQWVRENVRQLVRSRPIPLQESVESNDVRKAS